MLLKLTIFIALTAGTLGYRLQTFQTSTPSQEDQLRSYLSAQCRSNGAEDKIPEMENAFNNFKVCVRGLVEGEIEDLQREVLIIGLNGMAKKYCAKTPQFKTCLNTLIEGIIPCASTRARELIKHNQQTYEAMLDYMCYNDGERALSFIADTDSQCLRNAAIGIQECAKPAERYQTMEDVLKLSSAELCAIENEVYDCVPTKLTCKKKRAAETMRSMLQYVKEKAPCV